MADEQNPKIQDQDTQGSNTQKDPDDWVSGDDPMTGAQASYLKTLGEQADDPGDEAQLPGVRRGGGARHVGLVDARDA